jgi:hypothetical protein
MALVLGLYIGDSIYIGDDPVTLDKIVSDRQVVMRRVKDGVKFDIVGNKQCEVMPSVLIAMGDRSTTKMARIAITAPRNINIAHSDKYRPGVVSTMSAQPVKPLVVYPEVLSEANRIGIVGNTAEARLRQMATLAAPFTMDGYNRRFQKYILLVEQNTLKALSVLTDEELTYYENRTYEGRLDEERGHTGEAEVVWKDNRHNVGNKPLASDDYKGKFNK